MSELPEALTAALAALEGVYATQRRKVAGLGTADALLAIDLRPPASADALHAVEESRKVSLPDDYRAFLLLHDGASFGAGHLRVLGTADLRDETPLAVRAREYLVMSAEFGAPELLDCVPIANLGQPNDWLIFDPRARTYLYCLNADVLEVEDLAAALRRMANVMHNAFAATSAVHSITTRRARPEDAPTLGQAERDIARVPGRLASRPNEIDDEAFRAKIEKLNERDRGIYLVAEEDGAIVGHALLQLRDLAATSHVVELTIAVHEGHQGRGIGKVLMNELIAWAKANPRVERIELHVRSSNERAIGLYRSLGFVEEGRMKKRLKLGPNEYLDDVCMALWVL